MSDIEQRLDEILEMPKEWVCDIPDCSTHHTTQKEALLELIESARKEAVGASEKPQSGNKPNIKQVDTFISESVCQKCGGHNPVWFAPNELWNRVVGDRALVLCPICFTVLAESSGLQTAGWFLQATTKKEPNGSNSGLPEGTNIIPSNIPVQGGQ